MKKASLLALIGVGLLFVNILYYLIVSLFDAWQYDWYQPIGKFWQFAALAAWGLIGQFFLTIYKKSK